MILWRWLKQAWAWANWEPTWPEPVRKHREGMTSCTTCAYKR